MIEVLGQTTQPAEGATALAMTVVATVITTLIAIRALTNQFPFFDNLLSSRQRRHGERQKSVDQDVNGNPKPLVLRAVVEDLPEVWIARIRNIEVRQEKFEEQTEKRYENLNDKLISHGELLAAIANQLGVKQASKRGNQQ